MKKRVISLILGIILCLTIFSVPLSAEVEATELTETSTITENNDKDLTLNPILILTLVGLCTAGIVVTVKFTKMKF